MPLDLAKIQALCFDVDGTLRDTDDQYAHSALSTVDDAWRNVHQRSFANRIHLAIKKYGALAFENVVQLCRATMVVRFCAVDVDRVSPRRDLAGILAAQQPIAPAARATLPGNLAFVSNQ